CVSELIQTAKKGRRGTSGKRMQTVSGGQSQTETSGQSRTETGGQFLAETSGQSRTKTGRRERSGFGNALRIARTFAIVNVSWYFTCADSVSHALTMIRYSLTRFSPAALLQIPAGRPGTGTAGTPFALFALACGILLMLVYGILCERAERDETKPLPALPLAASFVMYLLLLVSIPLLAPAGTQGAFIYAQF
ncbi:MAG: hypothetical protein II868_09050, partial [Butyrivibrio sp.]|nr:hypothetical protein [Butyrivibrio sp.]